MPAVMVIKYSKENKFSSPSYVVSPLRNLLPLDAQYRILPDHGSRRDQHARRRTPIDNGYASDDPQSDDYSGFEIWFKVFPRALQPEALQRHRGYLGLAAGPAPNTFTGSVEL